MAFEPAARHATLVSTDPLSNVRRLVDNTVCDRPTTRTRTHRRRHDVEPTPQTRAIMVEFARQLNSPSGGGSQRYPGAVGLAEAPVANAMRIETVTVRSERSGDSTIEKAIKRQPVGRRTHRRRT
jgi:hypothetical protein